MSIAKIQSQEKIGYILYRFVKDENGDETKERVYKHQCGSYIISDIFHPCIMLYTCEIDRMLACGFLDGFLRKVKITQVNNVTIEDIND